MEVKPFLRWLRETRQQRIAYRFRLLAMAERAAKEKEKAQLAATN